jgi:nitrite reductase (NO-forming)
VTQPTHRPQLQSNCTAKARAGWPGSAVRVAFGVIWLVDASLKRSPGFRAGYLDYLRGGANGQAHWIKPWFTFWIDLQSRHVHGRGGARRVVSRRRASGLLRLARWALGDAIKPLR